MTIAALREAAQALLDVRDTTENPHRMAQRRRAEEALRAALAVPEPAPDLAHDMEIVRAARALGWEQGAEAMREAAARMLLAEERRHGSVRAKDALITAHTMLRLLPVPAETTEPDYGCKAHDRQGRRCLLQSEHADPCRFTDGAPEAKPAESDPEEIMP